MWWLRTLHSNFQDSFLVKWNSEKGIKRDTKSGHDFLFQYMKLIHSVIRNEYYKWKKKQKQKQ